MLSEDEAFYYANDTIAACRRAYKEQFSDDDAQILGYAPAERSVWDRMGGSSLCLAKPRHPDDVP